MRKEIRDLHRRLGVTMLYVKHDQVEAVTIADQVVLMNQGQVEQVALPRVVYETLATLFVAKFIGTPPIVTFCRTHWRARFPQNLCRKAKILPLAFAQRRWCQIRIAL